MNERRNVPEIVIVICELLRRSQTRINLLFTMSEIPHARPVKDATCEVIFRGRCLGDQSVDQWSTRLRSFELRRARFDRHARLRHAWPKAKRGGARRDRTDDLMLAKHALSQLSYGPVPEDECRLPVRRIRSIKVVGLVRLELPTSLLSSARSNQLSYKPLTRGACSRAPALRQCVAQATAPGACSSAKKEKRRRRNPANGAQRSGDRWPLMFQKRVDRAGIRRSRL